jgi:hypothetical protein
MIQAINLQRLPGTGAKKATAFIFFHNRGVQEDPMDNNKSTLRSLKLICLIPLSIFIILSSGCEILHAAPESVSPGLSCKNDTLWLKIAKGEHTLYVMKGDETIRKYPVAVGNNSGQKERSGDKRTPEGSFEVFQIQNSRGWKHDFRDGKGMIKGAYGPWFIRLKTPWKGIGIHGTHDPDSIGKNVTEGCIRLKNADLTELKENYIRVSMKVMIIK